MTERERGQTQRSNPLATPDAPGIEVTVELIQPYVQAARDIISQEALSGALSGLVEQSAPQTEKPGRPQPRVAVSWDAMQAFLTLEPQPDGYFQEEIRHALEKASITFGVDWDLVAKLAGNPSGCQEQLVAQGTALRHGVHGHIECLFGESENRGPVEQGGKVDWHELGLVKSEPVGTELARRHPPEPGTPGRTVRGRVLPCKLAKEAQWKLGDGAELSADDENLAISTVPGAPAIDTAGRLCVRNVHVVSGDVDLSTGNFDYLGSIIVSGNVLPGFKVKATHDIEIRGVVEDAELQAGGSVVAGAIVGSGRTVVQAAQDIHAKFANNACLKAGGNVVLKQEAMQCTIEAEGEVVVGGTNPTKGAVMGGAIVAGTRISVFRVGGMAGSKTSLRAGCDWVADRHLLAIDRETALKSEQLKKMEAGLERLVGTSDAAMPNKNELARKLEESASDLVTCLKELDDSRGTWQKLRRQPATICVHGPIRAGTELTIDGHGRILAEDRCSETFICEGNSVLGVAINKGSHSIRRPRSCPLE